MPRLAFLFVAVAALIGLLWWWMGIAVPMPASPFAPGERLSCLSYAPFHGGQSPFSGTANIPESQIAGDLERLSGATSCIRTYSALDGWATVTQLAGRYRLKVLQGIWLSHDLAANRREIDSALKLAHDHHDVIQGIVVGSESLLRGELSIAQVKDYLDEVRNGSGLPVTYADGWQWWLEAPELAQAVDFVTVHINQYWEGEPIAAERSVEHVRDVLRQVAAAFPGKKILVGEIGWPSAGRMRGPALPSRANQALVLSDLVKASKAEGWNLNFIEAFDQAWKRPLDSSWGLFEGDGGEPKFQWGEPVSNNPNWRLEAALAIGAASFIVLAGWFGSRSKAHELPWAKALAVAAIALCSGFFVGWAILDFPLVSPLLADRVRAFILLLLTFAVPLVAAAAVARGTPLRDFSLVVNPGAWPKADRLSLVLAWLMAVTTVVAIHAALTQVTDWRNSTYPLASLTCIVAALFIVAFARPLALPRPGLAEIAAAFLLSVSAALVVVSEGVVNWQAWWFAALLVALSLTALWVRPAQN